MFMTDIQSLRSGMCSGTQQQQQQQQQQNQDKQDNQNWTLTIFLFTSFKYIICRHGSYLLSCKSIYLQSIN